MQKLNHTMHKLAVLTASFPIGPVEGFLVEELDSLAALGCHVLVVPLWPRHSTKCSDSGGFTKLNGKVDFEIRPLIDFRMFFSFISACIAHPLIITKWLIQIILFGGRLPVRLKNIAVVPKAAWLAAKLRDKNIEHIHAHWAATPSTCAAIAAELAGIEWSMTCHRWDIYENNLLALKGRLAKFVRFISLKGQADAIDMGVPKEKAKLIRMGVKLPETAPTVVFAQQNSFVVFCAANLIAVKGHIHLIEAVARLTEQGYDVSLWLAGDGELRSELEQFAVKQGIRAKVRFLGFMDHTSLLTLYQNENIDLFVLPSITIGQGHHEGVPVALMEAMSYGIPVVSTQTGSIEELLPRELGVTVPERDSIALARIIEAILKQPELHKRIQEQQWEIIQSWSSIHSVKLLLKCIVDSVEEHVEAQC